MKSTIKLFYDVNEHQYYIYYNKNFATVLYKVENINPLNIMPVNVWGSMNPNLAKEVINEIEEFAINEFKKLNNGF